MIEPKTFYDVSSYAQKLHPPHSCPCQLTHEYFNNHVFDINKNEICVDTILALESTLKTSENYTKVARKHFLILAQKFHPDKNETGNTEICSKIMSILNKAYLSSHTQAKPDLNILQKVVRGKVFTYMQNELITCQHQECYAIYGHPAYFNKWVQTFTMDWKQKPTKLTKQQK